MFKPTISIPLFVSLVSLAGLDAMAAPMPARTAPVAPIPQGTALPLSKFMSQDGALRLERAKAETTLSVPLSARTALKSARLHLVLTNSAALLAGRSVLTVLLNGQSAGQIALNGAAPSRVVDLPLPATAFRNDYNRLTFKVAQHYTPVGCEDPFASELWTEIDPARSAIVLDTERQALAPRLADLDELFGPKDTGNQSLCILTAGGLDDGLLKAGSLVAQGVALRKQYVPLSVSHRAAQQAAAPVPGAFPGLDQSDLMSSDCALVGTHDQLAPFLSSELAAKIKGPFLGIYPMDANPGRVVVLVSGRNEEELTVAAQALALAGYPLPQTAETLVKNVEMPKLPDYAGRDTLLVGKRYTFGELGIRTQTLDGYFGQPVDLTFSAPPDLAPWSDGKFTLHLHFANGAGLRKDSVINIWLNKHLQTAILLNQAQAANYDDYKVEIPVRSLQPGPNTLAFDPHLMPSASDNCQVVSGDNLRLTLFEDSTVELSHAPHYVDMPNLSLLSRTGFPYTVKADGADTTLWVAAKDADSVSTAWTLAGRVAQTTGIAQFRSEVSFQPQNRAANLLVVGALDKLPTELLKAAPAGFGGSSQITAPARVLTGGKALLMRVGLEGAPSPVTFACQFQSPFNAQRTATVFAAKDAARLRAGVSSLIAPEVWDNLEGDLVSWDEHTKHLNAQKVGATYQVGELNPSERIGGLVSRYPLPFGAILVGLAALLSTSVLFLLRRQRA